MNRNRIMLKGWSNREAEQRFRRRWPEEPKCREQYMKGKQCGGCSFYAEFNEDWGLCCNSKSRHHTETVFEHFTCLAYVDEGWGPHSFTENLENHCWSRT